ncbi:MAG TPA: hypothetical protein VK604_24130, partial [Bryobacteraceae bacterium]|nr:hypothetical protein [Bryobacteraceae bacterium]
MVKCPALARLSFVFLPLLLPVGALPAEAPHTKLKIEATVRGADGKPLDGHLVVILSRDVSSEPRSQFTPYAISSQFQDQFQELHFRASQQAFGVDADSLAPGKPMVVDEETIGFPAKHLAEIPAGDYFVQGVFNVYETYHLASGKTVKLAPDRGEGQHWASKPGNFYSAPVKLHVDPAAGGISSLTLEKIIPPIPPASDTKYLRHIQVKSE